MFGRRCDYQSVYPFSILGFLVQRRGAYRVRTMSKGERIMAVIAEAATPTPRERSGYVESAMSVRPGSGSERTAERKEPVQDSRVRRRTL